MPALDISMIESLSRELHPTTNLMSETEVCPWTLFLTMSLTLLKGIMPHVPALLPMVISDPVTRSRAEELFLSEDFQNNIEEYFVDNIKADVQAPINRQIIQSSETVMYVVKLINNFFDYFMGGAAQSFNDAGKTDNMPRSASGITVAGLDVFRIIDFVRTMYNMV
jgi:hypothetical protein